MRHNLKPDNADDPETDYTLTADSVWIEVDNISVQICKKDDGVKIALYPVSLEDRDPLSEVFIAHKDAREAMQRALLEPKIFQFTITHNEPVWEQTVARVEVSEAEAKILTDDEHDEHEELVQRLLEQAVLDGSASTEVTDRVFGVDSDTQVEGGA